MFVGTVYCEFELSRSHPAFDKFRFLLVEPDHEVEFEGTCVVVDTVDAQVGEMVIVALAPLGDAFDIPDDLPIHGAVVGVVGAMTAPADEEEAEEEEAPRRRRGGRGGDAPRRDSSRRDPPKPAARAEETVEKERPPRKKPESKRTSKKAAEKAPDPAPVEPTPPAADDVPEKKPPRARKKTAKKTSKKTTKKTPPKGETGSSSAGDDLLIVWEAPGSAPVGDTTKRKAPRRRR
ncbi:MAG: hypothetical protein HRU14_13770 [Planctomycetes bacterium]|nr:hypothetical protein [Planctomycetota bacterium]